MSNLDNIILNLTLKREFFDKEWFSVEQFLEYMEEEYTFTKDQVKEELHNMLSVRNYAFYKEKRT